MCAKAMLRDALSGVNEAIRVGGHLIKTKRFADLQKGGAGGGGRREARKRGKGKGAPAIRTGVFVFCPPFSQLYDNVNCQYVTNHK